MLIALLLLLSFQGMLHAPDALNSLDAADAQGNISNVSGSSEPVSNESFTLTIEHLDLGTYISISSGDAEDNGSNSSGSEGGNGTIANGEVFDINESVPYNRTVRNESVTSNDPIHDELIASRSIDNETSTNEPVAGEPEAGINETHTISPSNTPGTTLNESREPLLLPAPLPALSFPDNASAADNTSTTANAAAPALSPAFDPLQSPVIEYKNIEKREENGSALLEFTDPHDFNSLQYVLIRNASEYTFAGGDFTLGAWIRTNASSTGTILSQGSYAEGTYYQLKMNSEGTLLFSLKDASNSAAIESQEIFNDTQWHYVAAVRQSNRLVLYVDGAGQASADVPPINLSNSGAFSIGADMGDFDWSQTPRFQFVGSIGEPGLWNQALSVNEIGAIWRKGR